MVKFSVKIWKAANVHVMGGFLENLALLAYINHRAKEASVAGRSVRSSDDK